jgi:hypothetical protein
VKGDRQALLVGNYGEPHTGKSLFGYVGEGEARNGGLAAEYQHFITDRWAMGLRLGGRYFDQSGNSVFATELEATARHYLFELGPLGVGLEATGGGIYASTDVPSGGKNNNWIYGMGPTFELPLCETVDLLFGYQWRHLSNGDKRSVNPTQNDHRVWIGLAFDF